MSALKTILFWILEWGAAKAAAYLDRMQRLKQRKSKDEASNQKAVDELKNADTEAERDAAANSIRNSFN